MNAKITSLMHKRIIPKLNFHNSPFCFCKISHWSAKEYIMGYSNNLNKTRPFNIPICRHHVLGWIKEYFNSILQDVSHLPEKQIMAIWIKMWILIYTLVITSPDASHIFCKNYYATT